MEMTMPMPLSAQQLDRLMRAHDILPTSQRSAIASVLFAAPRHLSADQVLEAVNQAGKKVSKATVYNTLNLFTRKGLVKEVVVDTSKVFYDSNTRPHHHFYNEDDGTLTDFPAESIRFASLPECPEGTEADDVEVVIRLRNQSGKRSHRS